MQPIQVLSAQTSRLQLTMLQISDGEFMWRLMNDPDWLEFIGDRGITDISAAEDYIANGPMPMYRDKGVGILLVTEIETGRKLGCCGLLHRPQTEVPDLGFAFLPEARGCGYAFEAAQAILQRAKQQSTYPYIDALVSPGNAASISLLGKLGFQYSGELPDFAEDRDTHCYRIKIHE